MSESPNSQARLREASASLALIVAPAIDPPTRDMLLQLRQGLIIQLKAIERILGLDKSIEQSEQKR